MLGLLPDDGAALYITRCDGRDMRMPRAALSASAERYVLVRNSRGALKLLDMGTTDDAVPRLLTRAITSLAIE